MIWKFGIAISRQAFAVWLITGIIFSVLFFKENFKDKDPNKKVDFLNPEVHLCMGKVLEAPRSMSYSGCR